MVYINYRIVSSLGIKRKIVYTALFRFTKLHCSTVTGVPYLDLRELRLGDAVSVCQFDHMRKCVKSLTGPRVRN